MELLTQSVFIILVSVIFIEISLPRSFPSGPVVAEFTKPVSSNMVAADNKTIVDAQLSNFTGYYWIGDICW